jgi:hypothetical protein
MIRITPHNGCATYLQTGPITIGTGAGVIDGGVSAAAVAKQNLRPGGAGVGKALEKPHWLRPLHSSTLLGMIPRELSTLVISILDV